MIHLVLHISYSLILSIMYSVNMLLFIYIARVISKVSFKLGERSLVYLFFSFVSLAVSQLLCLLSFVIGSPRLSLTVHLFSSSIAGIAFLMMIYPSREKELLLIPILLISSPDIITGLLGIIASSKTSSSGLRKLLASLSFTYLLRSIGFMLIYIEKGIQIVLVAEIIKTIAIMAFIVYHLRRVGYIHGKTGSS